MAIDFDDLFKIFAQAVGFFFIYYFLYKKYIYSIFDPLFFYAFTISFSSVLVLNVHGENEPINAIHFFMCNLFLFIGFASASYIIQKRKFIQKSISSSTSLADYTTFKLVVYATCGIYFFSNFVTFATTGFAFLSDDPTSTRLENLENGIAILSNINYALGGFAMGGLLFLILSKFKYIDLLLLTAVILFTILDGKKSVILRLMILLAMMVHHKLFKQNPKITFRAKLINPLGILATLFIIFVVFLKQSNEDSDQAILKFVTRLLYGADSTLFYYVDVNQEYFSQFHFWQYPAYLFNQILGLLRLVPLMQSNGDALIRNIFTNPIGVVSGPNTPYYIEGQIYFGFYGAFVYSVIVGACYAFIRESFLKARFYTAFGFVMICLVGAEATNLLIEVTYCVTRIFELFFFVMPIYIAVNFIVHGRLKWRRSKFERFILK